MSRHRILRRHAAHVLEVPQIQAAAQSVKVETAVEVEAKFPDLAPLFPRELKILERWIVRTADKTPHSAFVGDENLGPIDPHNPEYQADYNTAMDALDNTTKFSGAGFVFNYRDGYTGVDFDHCVNPETLEIQADVLEIVRRMDSYAEFSPSRTGIHVITNGWQFPWDGTAEGKQGSKVGDAEMYSGKRYFTVTGSHVPGTPLTVNVRDLSWLYELIVVQRKFYVSKSSVNADGTLKTSENPCIVTLKKPGVITSKYETLMRGTILRSKDTTGSSDFAIEDDAQILEYESQSSADFALLRLITDKLNTEDAEAIKAEFRNSPLGQRKKAEREDYLDNAINKLLKEPRQPFVHTTTGVNGEQTGISIDRPKLLTEVGNARRLIEAYGQNIRYCPEEDAWLHWGGKVWMTDRKAVHIHDLMKRVLMQMQSEAGALVSSVDPSLLAKLNKDLTPKMVNTPLTVEELVQVKESGSRGRFKKAPVFLSEDELKALEVYKTADAFLKWSKDSESSQKIRGSVEQARSEPGITITRSALDTNPLVCNLENGAFRFDVEKKGLVFGPHSREDLATKMMPVVYDPKADCPRFKAFIDWMFPEEGVRKYIQTYLGLCLTGIVVRRVLILYGEGANGKSTLMKVLYHMFGETLDKNGALVGGPYSQHVAFSTFAVGREETAGGARADLMPLKGARLISASESNKSSGRNVVKLDMARLKEMTGGDPTVARGLYQAEETRFINQGKIILQTNNVPSVSDDSDGAWDRLKKVDCCSRVEDKDQDENLASKLIAESSGIFNWLLLGLVYYFRDNLVETESINKSTEAYRGTENHMGRFVEDECEIVDSETVKTSSSEVYGKYKYWCQNNGEQPDSQRAFTFYLQRRKKVASQHTKHGAFLVGIKLKSSNVESDAQLDPKVSR